MNRESSPAGPRSKLAREWPRRAINVPICSLAICPQLGAVTVPERPCRDGRVEGTRTTALIPGRTSRWPLGRKQLAAGSSFVNAVKSPAGFYTHRVYENPRELCPNLGF